MRMKGQLVRGCERDQSGDGRNGFCDGHAWRYRNARYPRPRLAAEENPVRGSPRRKSHPRLAAEDDLVRARSRHGDPLPHAGRKSPHFMAMGYDRALLLHLATSRRLERGVKALPRGEALAWRAASRYVAGRTELQALQTAGALVDAGHAVSVDLFGERVDDPAIADQVVEHYRSLAAAIASLLPTAWLSVDLSHLAVDVNAAAAADRLETITRALSPGRRIQVGAETPLAPTRSSAVCSRWPAGDSATGSAPPSRPTCCAHRPTPGHCSTPASTAARQGCVRRADGHPPIRRADRPRLPAARFGAGPGGGGLVDRHARWPDA